MNAASTLLFVFALASKNSHPSRLARLAPSSVDTSLEWNISFLFPTITIGTRAAHIPPPPPPPAAVGVERFEPYGSFEEGEGSGRPDSSLTRRTRSTIRSTRSNVGREVIEYTMRNPSPSRIHWSRSAVYSSTSRGVRGRGSMEKVAGQGFWTYPVQRYPTLLVNKAARRQPTVCGNNLQL